MGTSVSRSVALAEFTMKQNLYFASGVEPNPQIFKTTPGMICFCCFIFVSNYSRLWAVERRPYGFVANVTWKVLVFFHPSRICESSSWHMWSQWSVICWSKSGHFTLKGSALTIPVYIPSCKQLLCRLDCKRLVNTMLQNKSRIWDEEYAIRKLRKC